ncbi:twin-arginine translocation signal domain-containing protein [Adlercreutzia sp. R25]|uniref:Twin-arginine translocation signal domain-containing protein n=1 Tax=Adlercreutzia shanghongiae TaxID=3111773 RepID=A0ABU6IWQ3_9ACTN|nr:MULTISPECIES: twin-arginine translocation signal domain-containing protein [unclassified Adlercreutzia]MEC4273835.1 twin-arginine translocation signal domain-containing protein [Adlercreutzia sp. R25]MEC4294110.1 twin-arginine translocation signal domain-containing protein [Adlercreutzia sp. R22]
MPGGHEVLLTRRHFLYGVAGVAAVAVVGGGAAWAAGKSDDDDALKRLKVPEDAVTTSNDLEEMENYEDAVTLVGSAKLPFGTLVWCSDDAVAACLLPTESAKPLAEVGLLDLASAECTTIIEHAVGEDKGFEIYDVRANSAGVIWTEADILDNIWRVYSAALSGTTLGEPQLLDEGDVNWEMPTLAVAGGFGFWQRLPQLEGNARVEDSLLKRAAFGTADAQVVYASQGRMACPPTSCGESIVATPRARTSGTYYQLTHLDAATGEVTDACVLPSSMKPMECGWGKTGFSFAFDGIYSYGEGIANLGTYLPLESPEAVSLTAVNEEEAQAEENEVKGEAPYLPAANANAGTAAYSDVPWFRFAANPYTVPSWCGNWLLIRGNTQVVAIDLAGYRYAPLPLEEGSNDYNDYLASTHMGNRAVTFSNVDYTPIGGEQQKHCLVRIWEPAS